VHHLLLVHTINGLHSSGQMLASCRGRRKDGVGRTITVHEGRHVLDQAFFRAAPLSDAELERRAKLSELQLGAFPRAAFSTINDQLMGGDTAHGLANSAIMRALGQWIDKHRNEVVGFNVGSPPITQIDRLSNAQIRSIAEELDPKFEAALGRQ
jgi:hypothetical protein